MNKITIKICLKKEFQIIILLVFSMLVQNTISFNVNAQEQIFTQIDETDALQVGNPFGVCHGQAGNLDAAIVLAEQGVNITRNDIPWSHIEPSNGTYYFDQFDAFYDILSVVGVEPLAILDYGNSLIYGEQYYRHIPLEQIPHWLQYVNVTVNRYKDEVKYWEIWNEPNLDKFWNGTDEEFFYLMNQTASLIREIDPSLIILAPGISGHNPEYLNKMIAYIGDDQFNLLIDVLNYHPYSGSNAEMITTKAEQVREVANAHHFSGEIWITEVGYSTQVSDLEEISEEKDIQWDYQATQLVKTYAQAIASNTSRIIWYCYRDWKNIDWLYGEAAFGIQHFDQSQQAWIKKPAGNAYAYLSQKLSGSTYYPNGFEIQYPALSQKDLFWKYHFYTPDNTSLLIIWSQTLETTVEIGLKYQGELELGTDFSITEYDYGNNIQIEKDATNPIVVDMKPRIFEINYTDLLIENSINQMPITIELNVQFTNQICTHLLLIPMIFLIGLGTILLNKKHTSPMKS